jgi:hypothetical protein
MSDNLDQFFADIASAGVDIRSADFVPRVDLSQNTDNVTAGLELGLAPRYGMGPIVCQNIGEAVDAYSTYGIYGAWAGGTAATTRSLYALQRVFAIIPVKMIDQTLISNGNDNPKTKKTYFWVCGLVKPTAGPASGKTLLVWVPLGESAGATFVWTPKSGLAYGLLRPLVYDNGTVGTVYPGSYRLSGDTTFTQFQNVQNVAQVTGQLDYIQTAVLSVSGFNEPCPWVIGYQISIGDANTSATPNFTNTGVPNFILDSTFVRGPRTWKLLNCSSVIGLEREYNFSKTPDYDDISPYGDQDVVSAHLIDTFVSGSVTAVARVDGTAPTYANAAFILWNDTQNVMNTEHTLLFAAAKKPLAILVQSWQRSANKCLEQWLDLRKRRFQPLTRRTIAAAGGRYTESSSSGTSATPVDTCWYYWPPFTEGTATQTFASFGAAHLENSIALGPANSGILRANTTYEFAYSVYDKQLGVESNVGKPAKIRTGTDDYVALAFWFDQINAGNYKQRTVTYSYVTGSGLMPISPVEFLETGATNTSYKVTNYVQFRVYYRPLGSFEWLPALFIDAAQYIHDPNLKELWACKGAIAGSVGGQVGGFNDYSDLPDDAYTSVVVWKNRVFWLSDKNMIFSLPNNGFCYPARNAIPIQSGAYKGALVHAYPGVVDQDSRLIVFGTKETYLGKFTGEYEQMTVQVDADSVGTFNVDGTDFRLSYWTSVTAFSYRSAVVADGVLYFWGPQGVYRDDGLAVPTKISTYLEPTLQTLYAKQKTDDIHCIYNEQTKEIIWFYFTDSMYAAHAFTEPQTKLLIYNTRTEQFFFGSTSDCIDAAQKITVGDAVDFARKTSGDRVVVFARYGKSAATGPHTASFFDQRCRAGDLSYNTHRLVNQIATPVAGSRRLTMPNGTFGIVVGDYISTDQIQEYTNNADSGGTAIVVEDFVAKITAVTSTYIDVLLPTDITSTFQGAATLGVFNAFPIYVNKTILSQLTPGNAIPYTLETTYWCPNGLSYNALWLYVHLMFKLELLKTAGIGLVPGLTFSHRTPVSNAYASQTINFGTVDPVTQIWTSTLNSDGHQQVYHELVPGDEAFEGQGLKLKIAGLHYAHKWVLQYLAAYAKPEIYDFLKRFEG